LVQQTQIPYIVGVGECDDTGLDVIDGVGVTVGVSVGVCVGLLVLLGVVVEVGVAVGVEVFVDVFVGVLVNVGVMVGVDVFVGLGVGVLELVLLGVTPGLVLGDTDGVIVGVVVLVTEGVGVGVGVVVFVGVGVVPGLLGAGTVSAGLLILRWICCSPAKSPILEYVVVYPLPKIPVSTAVQAFCDGLFKNPIRL
jgi:hypothetical protein